MRLWSAFWAWLSNNSYLALGIMTAATVVCLLLRRDGEASFSAMCAGTLL